MTTKMGMTRRMTAKSQECDTTTKSQEWIAIMIAQG